MKLFNKTLLFFSLTFTCAVINFAQPPSPPSPAPPKPDVSKPKPPPPPPPPAVPVKEVGKAKFYVFKNKTSASSTFLKRDKQLMIMSYDNPIENRGKNPDGVFMIFQSTSENGLKYKENHKLKILIGGRLVIEGDTKVVMSSCSPKKPDECFEVMFTPKLPFEVFEQMQKIHKVEIMFGETAFELTGEEKLNLTDLGSTTKL